MLFSLVSQLGGAPDVDDDVRRRWLVPREVPGGREIMVSGIVVASVFGLRVRVHKHEGAL